MDANNVLGEFLRARREQVRPEDVGLSGGGLRRVPGLRREEVATLAGISSDYYLRLEQGRDRNPSAQVLEALARVLRLDIDATRHLLGLTATGRRPVRRKRAAKPTPVPLSIRQLIDGWTTNPAYVQNRYADVLAVNALYSALAPHHVPGVNLLRAVFLDPGEREQQRDWEDLTAGVVAGLRARAGADVDDPRLVELVGELSLRSERFRLLWGRHDVLPMRSRVSRRTHPQVGDLDLYCDKLDVGGLDGLTLVVFHAEPGSRNAELLGLLGSLNAPLSAGDLNAEEQRRHMDAPGVDEKSDKESGEKSGEKSMDGQ
ncbi:helix-turn-helix transcriptional regulator [Streptomyces sp. SID12488]|uniref:helix-turn-helix domain-containing protein n=1 Tax=Streptomyces sp. SID12488 TaxID=2706040 RepID=UPI0013DC163D|nr:helix-turn-helix transcriptional regulator [Streptomyces sp. SID12488]NEA68603.1 helix-turn-helix domain-containing protein [Streptomyces sp. SID12488]